MSKSAPSNLLYFTLPLRPKLLPKLIRNQFCNVKIDYITGKLIRKQLCNVIRCPHGMLCNNARDYITEEIIRNQFCNVKIGHGEVRVYRGTGVSRGVRRTTWDRSLKNWELQIPCFEEFFWGGNTLGLVPASLPHTLGYACTFYAPTSPPPQKKNYLIIGEINSK